MPYLPIQSLTAAPSASAHSSTPSKYILFFIALGVVALIVAFGTCVACILRRICRPRSPRDDLEAVLRRVGATPPIRGLTISSLKKLDDPYIPRVNILDPEPEVIDVPRMVLTPPVIYLDDEPIPTEVHFAIPIIGQTKRIGPFLGDPLIDEDDNEDHDPSSYLYTDCVLAYDMPQTIEVHVEPGVVQAMSHTWSSLGDGQLSSCGRIDLEAIARSNDPLPEESAPIYMDDKDRIEKILDEAVEEVARKTANRRATILSLSADLAKDPMGLPADVISPVRDVAPKVANAEAGPSKIVSPVRSKVAARSSRQSPVKPIPERRQRATTADSPRAREKSKSLGSTRQDNVPKQSRVALADKPKDDPRTRMAQARRAANERARENKKYKDVPGNGKENALPFY